MVLEVPLAEGSAPGVEVVVEMVTEKDSISADILVEADIGKTVGKTLGKKQFKVELFEVVSFEMDLPVEALLEEAENLACSWQSTEVVYLHLQ